ncbi:MAG TPA: MarR family transcriptional regulator [Opitutaceae bacterium]|nr:MarR family transcriptional regulator [Opitutaceae bacterium]
MPLLLLKDLPRYECLLEAAKSFPDLDPSASEVFLNLLRTGDEVFRVADHNLARHEISQGRFTVLMLLLDKMENCPQPRTPAELADMAGVARATMTGLIDTLERDGLVKREPNPEDRRMMSVALTPKGETLIRSVLPDHFKIMAALMSQLSEAERKTLVRLLNKIVQQATNLSPGTVVAPDVATAAPV